MLRLSFVLSLNLDLFSASFPLACFLELQCDAKMLFLDDTISLQALQKIVVPLTLLIRELINTILQRDIFHISDITRPPPLVFSSGGFEASIPGKL